MTITTLLKDYTFQVVALGCAFLGIVSGVLGSFAVLRKQSLLGDGVSHAALPGVVMAFLLAGSKNTNVLLLGALISSLLAAVCIVGITRASRIKFDAALAVVMSVMFGLGTVLLTWVQKIPNASQAGLNRFIFGQASTLLQRDVVLTAVCGGAMLLVVVLFWKEFKLFSFDSEYAQCLGFFPGRLNLLLSGLLVLGIVIGLQTVGVILMSAMLITPAVAARQWTSRLWLMVLLSATFGAVSGIVGAIISSLIPQMPTGPIIVVCVSTIAAVSLLFAPGRGVLHRLWQHHKTRRMLLAKGGSHNVSSI